MKAAEAVNAGAPTAELEFVGVSAGYGKSQVLRDVSFSVGASSVVALLGPNGAGKTTTMRVGSGLLRPTSGQIQMAGLDVTGMPAQERAKAGLCLIPEGRGIFRSLTVRENLQLQVPKWHKENGIEPAIASFPALGKRLHQTAGSLSGGEQQMLALSRAFLSTPKVVLLDEVTLGLAPIVVDIIFQAIGQFASSGLALLIVEQYVTRAIALADYVCILYRGEVKWMGLASEVDEAMLASSYLGDEA